MTQRLAPLSLAIAAALLCSACVFAPPINARADSAEIAKLSEQAVITCGAGQVKEVNAKSFSCK